MVPDFKHITVSYKTEDLEFRGPHQMLHVHVQADGQRLEKILALITSVHSHRNRFGQQDWMERSSLGELPPLRPWKKRRQFPALRRIQDRTVNTIPHEQFGLRNISQCGESHAAACQFQTLLVIQPPANEQNDWLFADEEKLSDLYAFSTYALVLICQSSADIVEIQAIFDRQVWSERRMDQTLRQMDHIFHQIHAQDLEKPIAHIGHLHSEDQAQLASWNTLGTHSLL